MEMADEWAKAWRNILGELLNFEGVISCEDAAERFRKLLKTGLLKQTDLANNPERFFMAHRLVSDHALRIGPGFFIRFTVQYNLFSGTIVALGSEEQVASLDSMQRSGKLGCFGLTERFAGVNSGLIVNTIAEWDENKQMFRINSPDKGSEKNWISQGCTADVCVVIADLRIGGKSYGPHAFLMDFRQNGELVKGVTIGDMGVKTIGNDLDNAWIRFTDVWIPKSAMLSRYCTVEGNQYIQKNKNVKAIDMIAQRLYTGRVVIATSALIFSRILFQKTKEYSDDKKCWAPNDQPLSLSMIPQLKSLFLEADNKLSRMETYLTVCETRLRECLETKTLPSAELVEVIAVAKVKAVETAIDLCFRLKQEVGSYALKGGAGFEQTDYLICCKFAEGDSRILMQKLARDRMKKFQKEVREGKVLTKEKEVMLCTEITNAIKKGGKEQWNEQWRKVYDLAEAVMQRRIRECVPDAKL
jgi:alkylation response protein AidB-like acyl-CoA dehydrogenase